MAIPKKNASWLMPSFDDPPPKKSVSRKRKSSEILESNKKETKTAFSTFLRKENINSLATLLEACEPKKSTDLAVSRQKQKEISEWLEYKTQRGHPSALVLSGPSGCGKTAAIKVLANEVGFNLMEWITPVDQVIDENNRIVRQGDRFEDFLIRATRYSSVLCSYSRHLLLVKDFPNVYLQDKSSFHALLEKYFELGKEPIVFICTETGDSKIVRTLFPPEIREKFGIVSINVNAVTQTAMKNMLKRISSILNSKASHLLDVTQNKIDETLSHNIGDARSAVLNLIFSSLRVPDEIKKKECGSREESLGLLHGVGRVINPKRLPDGNSWKFVHDPDEIAAYFQSQTSTFLQFLQENYLNTMRSMEEVDRASDILSLGEVLSSEWSDANLSKVTLSLCIRGVMINNENPVPGWNPVRKPQSDRSDIRRDLITAEVKWYETLIKPKSTKSTNPPVADIADDLEDVIIE